MNSQQLFFINLILGLILLVYFWLGRSSKQKSPTRLNLKAQSTEEPDVKLSVLASSVNTTQPAQLAGSSSAPTVLEAEVVSETRTTANKSRELNLYFMYNGHDWEAHDVLGIPRGASLPIATQAYQELVKKSDPSTFEFYEAAYNTILKKRRADRL